MTKPTLRGPLQFTIAALLLAGATAGAHAGAVYRCNGPNGQTAITNKPQDYQVCSKVPGTDYGDGGRAPAPNAALVSASPTTAPKPAKAPAPIVAAAAPTVAAGSARGEYRSAPPSPFADVVSVVSVNGVVQKASTQNATERVDKATEIRRGAVYKVARSNGITEYTNVRPAGAPYQLLFTYIATCYACSLHSAIDFATTALNLDAYRREIATAAAEFGVDPALLRAVMHAESAFNPNAISNAGAQGLMQLMPATAADVGVTNPFDSTQNIRGGARYLGLLLQQFNGDERLATAAYNAGPQNVQKYSGIPPFDETRVYVERVGTLRKRYGAANVKVE
ncbi:MAG: lytic transglycosylase domain-containing protein [Rudaea sp.]